MLSWLKEQQEFQLRLLNWVDNECNALGDLWLSPLAYQGASVKSPLH